MEHSTHFDRERTFANRARTEEDCAGRILFQPSPEHSDVASVIRSVVALRCSAHRSVSRFVHELGCGDSPSNGFCICKPRTGLLRTPHALCIASTDTSSE